MPLLDLEKAKKIFIKLLKEIHEVDIGIDEDLQTIINKNCYSLIQIALQVYNTEFALESIKNPTCVIDTILEITSPETLRNALFYNSGEHNEICAVHERSIGIPTSMNLILISLNIGYSRYIEVLTQLALPDEKEGIFNVLANNNNYFNIRYGIGFNYTEMINKLFKIMPSAKHKNMIDSIATDNYLEFRKAVKSGYLKSISIVAYYMNDIDRLKDIFNQIDDADTNDKIKIYKHNPRLVIDLGRAHHNLLEQNWSSEDIEEIKPLVKNISILFQISKGFRDLDKYTVLHIMDYATYDFRLTEGQKSQIINILKDPKPKYNNYAVKAEAEIVFLDKLIEQRNSATSLIR